MPVYFWPDENSQSTGGASVRLSATPVRAPAGHSRALSGVPATLYGTPSRVVSRSSPQQPRKRIKLEERLSSSDEVTLKRQNALDYKLERQTAVRRLYEDLAAELYYLEEGGDLLDLPSWLTRPPLPFLNHKKRLLQDSDDEQAAVAPAAEVKVPATGGTPVAVSNTLPSAVTKLTHVKGKPLGGRHGMVFGNHQATAVKQKLASPLSAPGGGGPTKSSGSGGGTPIKAASTKATSIKATPTKVTPTKSTPTKSTTVKSTPTKSTPTKDVSPHSGSADHMLERAKQEAHVMQRISHLRKQGLWSERRLPKVVEPKRIKTHWDYLLEEMQWLAADFAQERKWKKAAARKCARMVQKYHQDQAAAAERAVRDQERELRRLAAFAAREVRQFWANAEKLVEYKLTTRLEEKRRRALDQHLNFIVNQTERYSEKLQEALQPQPSVASSTTGPPDSRQQSDGEFAPESGSEDDEETIAAAERGLARQEAAAEVAALERESHLSLDDVLHQLPPGYWERRQQALGSEEGAASDSDFEAESGADSDDEETIAEQEGAEGTQDHRRELSQLEDEGQMPLEELMKKYRSAGTAPVAQPQPLQSESDEEDASGDEPEEEEEDELEEDDDQGDEDETEMEIGLRSLLEGTDSQEGDASRANLSGPTEITDVAAMAETFQPKGYTLSSTTVSTPVPFLLRGSLREYQHVGLEWMATMYEKKLNGILADEMGLGKTIQTIALLAHLACVKGIWGPHLIVVPTSVMLNWEMELKKWCPAFKILVYYGSQKERRLKRTGWTKQNSFHVCITSYKLVLQDHGAFRRKKWKYLILDEAQNIKNFKSQRWQLLLNFQSQRRLLLTGTPLQNNLMELWSLMHFLMPHVFASHREFKEWFSNPVSGMIEGNTEYSESIIKRLHKVLRPFLLRRLKTEVEKQLPKKYEHALMCRLSKRQRFLYDEFMSRTKTKETLASGSFLSVINILMQLRKVCNHPDMFETRPIVSPLRLPAIEYVASSRVVNAMLYDPFKHVDLGVLNLLLADLELWLTAFAAHRTRRFQASRRLIEEVDVRPPPPPRCPAGRIRLHVRATPPSSSSAPPLPPPAPPPPRVTAPAPLRGYALQVVQGGVVKTIPLTSLAGSVQLHSRPTTHSILLQPGKSAITGLTAPRPLGNGARLTTPATVDPQSLAAMLAARGLPPNTSVTFARLTSAAQQPQPPLRPPASNALVNSVPAQPTVSAASPQSAPASRSLPPRPAPPPAAPAPPPSGLLSPRPTPPPSPGRHPPGPAPSHAHTHAHAHRRPPHSVFRINSLEEQRKMMRKEKLLTLYRINRRRCEACPIYGGDLVQSVRVVDAAGGRVPAWNGLAHCTPPPAESAAAAHRRYWRSTDALQQQLLPTVQQLLDRMQDVLRRYVVYTPAAVAPQVQLHCSHPVPWRVRADRLRRLRLTAELSPAAAPLHPIASAMATQFPERRLIQYDCGKLQVLDRLLHELRAGGHRVLIFTQMTRMLDVLEQFLNYHGLIYLRLDGTTRVDQRQALMERFNADRRVFCFILSTRSGGVGVNLTGADTVVFYDSDWNPTMDAQAQDRCHRIGQTRDVHIYRLVSEKTIEENIVKKANQKRLLGDLAIEGGNFTTAFFKKNTLHDIFDVDMRENDARKRMAEVAAPRRRAADQPLPVAAESAAAAAAVDPAPSQQPSAVAFEAALAAAEDDADARAACTARAEADAEMAEFDENIPLEEPDEPETSKAEQELKQLVSQLTPVERWAMTFVEATDDAWQREADRAAAEIDARKRQWEVHHQQAMRDSDASSEPDTPPLTYPAPETNQVWISENGGNLMMPVWAPPTPPRDDADVFLEPADDPLYMGSPMTEAQLPPVYVKKEPRRIKTEPAPVPIPGAVPAAASGAQPMLKKTMKLKREDPGLAPRSLFNRLSPAALKLRRDLRLQQRRTIFSPGSLASLPAPKPALMAGKAALDEHAPDWLVHEDCTLLQAIKTVLELPLSLAVVSPAHTPNWDLVADLVNRVGRAYRSPKQCRLRFENTIQPREEGKLVYDPGPKKSKKHKLLGPGKLSLATAKTSRPLRTSQLALQDKNQAFSGLFSQRFESMKTIANKRAPTTRPSLLPPANRNPKHAAVLAEQGIDYDSPLTPSDVAQNKAQRLAKQKQNTASAEQLSRLQKVQVATAGGSSTASLVTARPHQLLSARTTPAASTAAAIVSVASLNAAQVQVAQRFVSSGLAAAAPAGKATLATSIPLQSLTQKSLTPSQLQALKQQTLLRQKQLTLDAQKRLQMPASASAAAQSGQPQKLQVAVTSLAGVAAPVSAVTSVSSPAHNQARTQVRILKQAAGKQMVAARTMTESEMAAILKQSQLVPQLLAQVQARAGASPPTSGAVTASSSAGSAATATQTLTIPVTAISVAGVSLPQMRAANAAKVSTASQQQQFRQLALQKQLLTPQRKLATQPTQMGTKRMPAQLSAVQIVPAQKQLPTTVTVQQIQQVVGRDVIKVPPTAARGSPSQLQARVLPAPPHHLRQTIQVVSASGGGSSAMRPLATLQARPPTPASTATATAVQVLHTARPTLAPAAGSAAAAAHASSPQQMATVALTQLKQVSGTAGPAALVRGSPYTMRLRTVPGVPADRPSPVSTPPPPPPPPPDSAQ